MSKQAQVGAFAILALLLLFAIFYVITDLGTRYTGYRVGVHFNSAAGLTSGSVVYFSGVTVGSVDSISLLPDHTVDVIMIINRDVEIPVNSRFLIQAPLTGSPNLLIVPPVPKPLPKGIVGPTPEPPPVAILARRILPISEQPQGQNTATVADLLQEGQGQLKRLDSTLAVIERRTPALLDTLQQTMDNANRLTVTADTTVVRLSAQTRMIADTLQSSLGRASANVVQLTDTLNQSVSGDSSHVARILKQLDATSVALSQSVDSLRSLATNRRLHASLLDTAENIAQTTRTIAKITHDLHSVTGNAQTRAQLRDTIAHLDATVQKANSLLGALGGKSHVYGVDAGATPAPAGTSRGAAASNSPAAASGSPTGKAKPHLAALVNRLVSLQLRMSVLSAQRVCCPTSLFSADRGPQTDLNATLLPHASTNLLLGANDIGAATTWNLVLLHRLSRRLSVGGGILYSRLGVLGRYGSRRYGILGRLYDPRRPTIDLIGDLRVAPGTSLFLGQRAINHAERRTVYGVQYQF